MKSALRVGLVCVLALVLGVGSSPAGEVEYGAATPQELVQRLENGAAAEDVAEMVRCLDPEARTTMAAMMTVMPVMMLAFGAMAGEMAEGMAEAVGAEEQGAAAAAEKEMEALKKDFTALLAKYGIGDPFQDDAAGFDPEVALAKVDQGAYVADILAFMSERFPGDAPSGAPLEGAKAGITDLKVDGDRATAKAGDETVEMVLLDGRWYVHMPDPAGGAPH